MRLGGGFFGRSCQHVEEVLHGFRRDSPFTSDAAFR